MFPIRAISTITSLVSFTLGFPTAIATYYQAWKTRQEAAQARAGLIYSKNCLEFVLDDGTTINLVSLETLHTLPRPGEIVLLPGSDEQGMSAYRVSRIEHIYSRLETKEHDPKQARLIKAVAHVCGLLEHSEGVGELTGIQIARLMQESQAEPASSSAL
jgi:hypothetical protein